MSDTLWRFLIEPLFRHWPTYPPDWQRRRTFVFRRALGRCERCGLAAGKFALRDDGWRVARAHVHHVIPIAAGGRHHLNNLQVRCGACHQLEHPDTPLTPPSLPGPKYGLINN